MSDLFIIKKMHYQDLNVFLILLKILYMYMDIVYNFTIIQKFKSKLKHKK